MSVRVPFTELKAVIKKAMLNAGLSEEQAARVSEIHASSSLDGVESHGLNRVPRFIDYVRKGWVNLEGKPTLTGAKGAAENYDGQLGIGVLNAEFCADRAVALAKEHGIGIVSLKNTTHWMRGGTYAWQTAEKGFIGINWTNTESSMPLWGSKEEGVGNNPMCIAIPRADGPIVFDMAMSLYSWGKIGTYRLSNQELPYPGGFDKDGNLTSDPAAIEESRRILPVGYWKGTGLAFALDMAATALANGNSGSDMDADGRGSCTGASQIFIALDPYLFGDEASIQEKWAERSAAAHKTAPIREGDEISLPGERTLQKRASNLERGVPVDEKVWAEVQALAEGSGASGAFAKL